MATMAECGNVKMAQRGGRGKDDVYRWFRSGVLYEIFFNINELKLPFLLE